MNIAGNSLAGSPLVRNIPDLRRHWQTVFAVFYGAFVLLPFLAPVLMHLNLDGLGQAVYFIYSFLCHQLPERSLFFFGPKGMYSLAEIQAVWPSAGNPLLLRQFEGNMAMGWKVAWSDRMISLYGGIWLFGLAWSLLGRKAGRLPVWGLVLLALPMALDGGTHFLSDLGTFGQGFRDTNAWLALVTGHVFPATFYAGDALGSFNSWLRWLTGFLFSFGFVWWTFPYLDEALGRVKSQE